jgi:hypothetical protein
MQTASKFNNNRLGNDKPEAGMLTTLAFRTVVRLNVVNEYQLIITEHSLLTHFCELTESFNVKYVTRNNNSLRCREVKEKMKKVKLHSTAECVYIQQALCPVQSDKHNTAMRCSVATQCCGQYGSHWLGVCTHSTFSATVLASGKCEPRQTRVFFQNPN